MTAVADKTQFAADHPHVIKDISLAKWGRTEIEMAEIEMPGLMALREEFGNWLQEKCSRMLSKLQLPA